MKIEAVRSCLRERIAQVQSEPASKARTLSASEFAKAAGCSRPTALRALNEAEAEGYVDARVRGVFIVRSKDARMRWLRSRSVSKRVAALVGELAAADLQVEPSERAGWVRMHVDDLRALVALASV